MSSILNYSVPAYQVLIGTFDITRYLGTLSISTGIADINSPYLWRGSFEVFFTHEAEKAGLTAADFSEIKSPQRWRKGLQPVTLRIQGYPVAKLRIEDYRYSEANRSGQGQLFQLPALLDFEQPSLEVEGVEVGAKTPISLAVMKLIQESGRDRVTKQVFFAPSVTPPSASGEIDTRLITQRPLQDAQRLAGIFFNWMVCNFSETILFRPYPRSTPPLFSRGLKQVEIEPDYSNINFAAETVIVTGSKQVAKKAEKATEEEKEEEEEEKKPSEVVTETYGILGAVVTDSRFFDPNGGLKYIFHFPGDRVLVEKKTIRYEYDKYIDGNKKIRKGEVISTVTEREVLLPTVVNSDFYDPNDNITTGFSAVKEYKIIERITETSNRKIVEQMAATFMDVEMFDPSNAIPNPSFSPKDLVVRSDEKTGETGFKSSSKALPTSPNRPEAEEELPDPELEMETQTFKGVARLSPVGWSAFMPKTRIENVGFLPSQGVADRLALDIALIELQRRDAQSITLPPPLEWLQAGCPFFFGAHIHDSAYIADALILAIAEGEISFSFTGNRTGAISPVIPNPPDPIPFIPKVGLNVVPPPSVDVSLGQQVSIPIQAFNTNGGTSFTYAPVTPLPPGLAITPSGTIEGTPSAPFAGGFYTGQVTDTTTGETQTYSIWLAGIEPTSPVPEWEEVKEYILNFVDAAFFNPEAAIAQLVELDASLFNLGVLQHEGIELDRSFATTFEAISLIQVDASRINEIYTMELSQVDRSYSISSDLSQLEQIDDSYSISSDLPQLKQKDTSILIDSFAVGILNQLDSSSLVSSGSTTKGETRDMSGIPSPYGLTAIAHQLDASTIV